MLEAKQKIDSNKAYNCIITLQYMMKLYIHMLGNGILKGLMRSD